MGFLDNFTNKFTETVFYKKDSELEYQIQALETLLKDHPNNYELLKKLKLCNLGLQGEKEIEFELKNSNCGMYVLHDINLKYNDLSAQIDYIIITPAKVYFVECKNLIGNITVDNKGNFIREYELNQKKIKEGIYSPITQAQRHIEVFKKIWIERNTSIIDKTIRLKNFHKFYVPLVVLSNSKSILDDTHAPKEIKESIVRSDRLIDFLKNDIEITDKDLLYTQKEMHNIAYSLMENYNKEIHVDYEEKFQKLLTNETDIKAIFPKTSNNRSKILVIRNNLIEYRKNKAKEKGIPAYYIFTNEELDKMLVLMPKTINQLSSSKILPDVKLKLHGEEIIKIINT